jgi:hypothetical protein
MRFFNNGSPADSFSPLVAAGTVSYAEIAEPFHIDFYARVGGALFLSMGLWLQYDPLEPKRGSGGGGSAGAAKAANGLDGLSRPDCYGRQVVIAVAEDSDSALLQPGYSAFAGVFTGLVATSGGGYGYNMPAATLTAASDSAAANSFTFLGAATTPCIDPLNGGRSYAKPGDIIGLRRFGPAVAWVNTRSSTIASSAIGFSGAGDTPISGTASLTTVGTILGMTLSAPAAYSTTGAEQGCKVLITH